MAPVVVPEVVVTASPSVIRPPPGLEDMVCMGPPPGLEGLSSARTPARGFSQTNDAAATVSPVRFADAEGSDSDDETSLCSTIDTEGSNQNRVSAPFVLASDHPVPSTTTTTYEPGRAFIEAVSACKVEHDAFELRQALPIVVELADRLPSPVVDEESLPSAGSAGHVQGVCTPCEFIHKGLCRPGVACKFCHLCTIEDLKRYKKEKALRAKTARLNGQCASNTGRCPHSVSWQGPLAWWHC